MTVNFEAKLFSDAHQASSLATWCGGVFYTGTSHGHTDPPWADHVCITPMELTEDSKTWADPGDWIIRAADGTCRIEKAGSQDGYCIDCGEPVWWQDGRLVVRGGRKWCFGKDEAHVGMSYQHALPGMPQWVARSPEGQVCHCLNRAGPHIHQIIMIEQETVMNEPAGTVNGWTWNEEAQRWTVSRGGILVTAWWHRDTPPPVQAGAFAVQMPASWARLYGLSATEWLHLASEGPDSEVAPCCGDIGQLREYLQVLTTSQGPGESALLARGLLAAYETALASHDTLNDEKTFPLLHRVLAGARATLEHEEALRREYAESVRNRPEHGEQS